MEELLKRKENGRKCEMEVSFRIICISRHASFLHYFFIGAILAIMRLQRILFPLLIVFLLGYASAKKITADECKGMK